MKNVYVYNIFKYMLRLEFEEINILLLMIFLKKNISKWLLVCMLIVLFWCAVYVMCTQPTPIQPAIHSIFQSTSFPLTSSFFSVWMVCIQFIRQSSMQAENSKLWLRQCFINNKFAPFIFHDFLRIHRGKNPSMHWVMHHALC